MSVDTLLPLELLCPGDWAEVRDVAGEPGWVARLAELGVRVGCRLQLLQTGPPCLIFCAGARLCLRGSDDFQVFVQPLAES
ncbi:MAG: ferrous iron transport protein A [Planctomycetia bacterium]|nr:ferrous iron transport protein A [Planctomycetia bacterium]